MFVVLVNPINIFSGEGSAEYMKEKPWYQQMPSHDGSDASKIKSEKNGEENESLVGMLPNKFRKIDTSGR